MSREHRYTQGKQYKMNATEKITSSPISNYAISLGARNNSMHNKSK